MGYTMSHGDVAVELTCRCGWARVSATAPMREQQRFETLLKAIGLPYELPESVTVDGIMDAMLHDKKGLTGVIRFVFQRGIGDLVVFDGGAYVRPVDGQGDPRVPGGAEVGQHRRNAKIGGQRGSGSLMP